MLSFVEIGASFTAVTLIVRVSVSDNAPPVPVLPPSFVTMVSVTAPFAFAAGLKTGAEPPAKNELIFASVPVNTTELVPEPETVTDPPVVAAIVPEFTDKVTVTVPLAASTSLIDKPVKVTEVSSFVVYDAGIVFTGASFTAVTVIATVSESDNGTPAESVLRTVSVADPLKLLVPWKLKVASAALI